MPDILDTPAAAGAPPRRAGRVPPRGRRALRRASSALIVLGALALLDAGVTLVWQEPFSALYAQLQQDRLRGTLAGLERAVPTGEEHARLERILHERRRVAFLAGELQRRAALGSAVGRIRIPRIGVDFVVVYGTGVEELEKGPGIYTRSVYPGTRFPGLGGTTAIAGHRTTFLEPFRRIDELRRGDRILLDMPYAHFVYTVVRLRVVAPTDVASVVGNAPGGRLVLSACTPLWSAAERLLVEARLTRTVPAGAASAAAGSMRRRATRANAAAAATLTQPTAKAAEAPRASTSEPPRADPPAMPATVAARCHVNASVTVPCGASAPTSVNWQVIIGANARPATTASPYAAVIEWTTTSGATAAAIAASIAA
jgi:sortase A